MTTVSIINPEVVYRESKTIDDEDIGYKSQVYVLDVEDGENTRHVSIVLGKPKYIYTSKNIVFFPIYAVQRSRVRAQIGVFEVESTKLLNVYRQGEIDVARLSAPLLYSFSKPNYLVKLEANPDLFESGPLTPAPATTQPMPGNAVAPIIEDDIAADREDAHLALNVDKSRVSRNVSAAQLTVKDGVFEDIAGFKMPEPLVEETKEMAENERSEYKESARNTWIEKYMRNNQYRIHEVEANGDCLFAVVRDAFADVGKKTTVDKLRALLVAEMTDDVFQEYRTVYLSFKDELETLERDLKSVENSLKEFKRRIKETGDRTAADSKELVAQSKLLVEERDRIKEQIKSTEELNVAYTGDLNRIDTLEKMRQHIQTTAYWADSWAISTLERLLNVKLVLFSQGAFEATVPDLDGVFLCSEVSKHMQERQSFAPDYYIMATYSGDHYRLISYKSRKIFQFREIPYDVKILVLNRCLSRMSGIYYMIQDFRNWKTRFGIDEDEGHPDDYDEHPSKGELFDPKTVFVFYAKSDKSVKPGKGDGEKILAENVAKYAPLGTKKFLDWRKMLDDEWDKDAIIIDGHKWTSITHYMRGVQYKKTHPDVYLMFSLDSDPESDLATNVRTAKQFKGLTQDLGEPEKDTAAAKKKPLKKPEKKVRVIAPDLDFDERREVEERAEALKAKFLSIESLKTVLKMTHDALLLHKGSSGNPPEPDNELMRVRAQIEN